ncbi:radical SAM protein [Nonomuraea sp. NPDC004702]
MIVPLAGPDIPIHRSGAAAVCSTTAQGQVRALSMAHVEACALAHDVPVEDVLLIAINLLGISSTQPRNRARLTLRLARSPRRAWMVIVPLNQAASPFHLHDRELVLDGVTVAEVDRIDADDAVGGYFRRGGRALTLNPNARSRCVGCAFCPNTLEAAADPRMGRQQALEELLAALRVQHPRGDLSEVEEVTVSTGCFEREEAALAHLVALRAALAEAGVGTEAGARIGFLSSVLRSSAAFEQLAEQVSPFVLRLTAECFTRRDVMLKSTKADLTSDQMPGLLARARRAGLDTSYTYIVGLDPLADMNAGVAALAGHVTAFPNFQVFQAHNPLMAQLRVDGADALDFYLDARARIEQIMAPLGLRPAGWECYRPLWYSTFAGQELGDDAA